MFLVDLDFSAVQRIFMLQSFLHCAAILSRLRLFRVALSYHLASLLLQFFTFSLGKVCQHKE